MHPLLAAAIGFGLSVGLLRLTARFRTRYWFSNLLLVPFALFLSGVVCALITAAPKMSGRHLVYLWFWYGLIVLGMFVYRKVRGQGKPDEPGAHADQPRPDEVRDGFVGGIESIVLDGQVLYFGYSYSSDFVLSPLFSSVEDMAGYAQRNIQQKDGKHDLDYWRELVEEAAEESGLCEDEDSRTFSSNVLGAIPGRLRQMAERNAPDAGIRIDYHLLYLFDAASKSNDVADSDALRALTDLGNSAAGRRLGLEGQPRCSEISELLAVARGEADLPDGAGYRDVAVVVQGYLDVMVPDLIFNWPAYFAGLQSGGQ